MHPSPFTHASPVYGTPCYATAPAPRHTAATQRLDRAREARQRRYWQPVTGSVGYQGRSLAEPVTGSPRIS